VELAGVTTKEVNWGVPTVRLAFAEIEPMVAVTHTEPSPELVARPFEPVLLLMIATITFEVPQVTLVVMSFVLKSVKYPVAVNCCVVPRTIVDEAGVIIMEVRAAGVTVRFALAETEPEPAVIVTVPTPAEVTSPIVGGFMLTVATVASEEAHATEPVKSCELPSLNVPVAVNCCVVPRGIEGVDGATVNEVSTAGVTWTVVVPKIPEPSVAVTLVRPT
jgi:hypothetical protein